MAGSYDGKQWEKMIDLEEQPSGGYSYPAIIQDKAGIIHITYTYTYNYTYNRESIKFIQLKCVAGR